MLVLAAAAFGFATLWDRNVGIIGFAACVAAILGRVLWDRFNTASASKRWLYAASAAPIVLVPPFTDRWRVEQGGPDPRHNRYQRMGEEYFAYDFVRENGPSFDEPILAPCDGMIVHVESRQADAAPQAHSRNRKRPFGNYVSIETSRGYVILSHLRQGSVTVRVGGTVRAGDEIGRCGNSGTSPHALLHVHAQSQPSRSIEGARAVPIAFRDRGAREPLLLEFGDGLG
ncbi:MAG TPA: M23 family metallopeptidase [Candidatus Acidoferrales bacterium]|nr:M23 family metallopeptidase [Candidatus Acidoferrales bacterium]